MTETRYMTVDATTGEILEATTCEVTGRYLMSRARGFESLVGCVSHDDEDDEDDEDETM